MTLAAACVALACSTLAVSACGSGDNGKDDKATPGARPATGETALPQGSQPVELNPAQFTTKVDNPYWPMRRGSRWVYDSRQERIVGSVTDKEKTVSGGIEALTLRDVVTAKDGDLVEVTDDWYAQDPEGNVWYLGEDTKEYKGGKVVSTSGSWEHGVDGAYAGVIMPAKPRPGLVYRQEYYKGEAEDRAKVLSVDAKVTVPFGTFDNCVETEDTTPLEPNVVEHKYYARNTGPVLRTTASGGGREELVSFTR